MNYEIIQNGTTAQFTEHIKKCIFRSFKEDKYFVIMCDEIIECNLTELLELLYIDKSDFIKDYKQLLFPALNIQQVKYYINNHVENNKEVETIKKAKPIEEVEIIKEVEPVEPVEEVKPIKKTKQIKAKQDDERTCWKSKLKLPENAKVINEAYIEADF
jgi:hypothetical protein